MLFFLYNLFLDDPGRAIVLLPVIVLTFGVALLSALTVHEFSHAFVAHRLGDETARRLGRLSLNPIKHLDPAGTMMLIFVGFGWGKPVPVNFSVLQQGRRGMALVSLAGPGSNFVFAILLAGLVRAFSLRLSLDPTLVTDDPLSPSVWLGVLFTYGIFYNLILGIFNLIPIAPLDGSKVAIGLAPRDLATQLLRFESYGQMVLILIVAADVFFRVGILGRVIFPPVSWLSRILTGESFI